jgi:hypothetical protein
LHRVRRRGGFSGRTRRRPARKGAGWKGQFFWGSDCCCSGLTTTLTELCPPAKYETPSCLPPCQALPRQQSAIHIYIFIFLQ